MISATACFRAASVHVPARLLNGCLGAALGRDRRESPVKA